MGRQLTALGEQVAEIAMTHTHINCDQFLMYFINKYQKEVLDLHDFVQSSGKSMMALNQLQVYLKRVQLTYLKIIAIASVFTPEFHPPNDLKYLMKYQILNRDDFIAMIRTRIQEDATKMNFFSSVDAEPFDTEFIQYLDTVHLRVFHILFKYYTFYKYSNLPHSTKTYILSIIARLLTLITTIHLHTLPASVTINLPDTELLEIATKLDHLLNIFIACATQSEEMPLKARFYDQFRLPPSVKWGHETHLGASKRDVLLLFTSRKCPSCQKFFDSPLWEFLLDIAKLLEFQVQIIDIIHEADNAICKGVYGINQTPSLLYRSHVLWLNPAEEPSPDPHATMKRELLDFFGILGLVPFHPPANPPSTPQKKGEADKHAD